MSDLASRVTNRVQISSDALKAYEDAIERGFGSEVDYGQIVKTYSVTRSVMRRHQPPSGIARRKM
jgi:hypothetical protein